MDTFLFCHHDRVFPVNREWLHGQAGSFLVCREIRAFHRIFFAEVFKKTPIPDIEQLNRDHQHIY